MQSKPGTLTPSTAARLAFGMDYYRFGLALGARFVAGDSDQSFPRRAVKLLNPVLTYSRFAEYFAAAGWFPRLDTRRVLDVGSPKLFPLYMAARLGGQFVLTDLWDKPVREFESAWRAVERRWPGSQVDFQVADGTQLAFEGAAFTLVVSISVVEHIPVPGDRAALAEFGRVLAPGGHAVISVPYGPRHTEQRRRGFAYGDEADRGASFFQRVYDRAHLDALITASGLELVDAVSADHPRWLAPWRSLPSFAHHLLGPATVPLGLSRPLRMGLEPAPDGNYAPQYRKEQVAGDAILLLRKASDSA